MGLCVLLASLAIGCKSKAPQEQQTLEVGESAGKSVAPTPLPEAEAPMADEERADLSRKLKAAKRRPSVARLGGRPPPPAAPRPEVEHNTESYDHQEESGFKLARNEALSTFSIDNDTASYSNVRRFLNDGQLPPKGAVRLEELVNYFSYTYPPPKGPEPFSTEIELTDCPWAKDHWLARIGLKGRIVEQSDRKPANLVFLLDVSGSMNAANKLPLLKRALKLAVNQLTPKDRVAIAVYAGASGLALPSTRFDDKQRILEALRRLEAGGSTNGGAGIELAYATAKQNFIPGGINRVILATDGDFNVGVSSRSALVDMVQAKAKDGIFLTVLGFGMGNLKDDMLEQLADKGNGSYAYIDDFQEARKVFSDQISGTLETIAKDVKIQVDFNPAKIQAYRLLGYENRRLAAEDFNDDTKDAGEIGAGHTVTALYQIVPVGKRIGFDTADVQPSKYQQKAAAGGSDELFTVRVRYKQPDADVSAKLEFPVAVQPRPFLQSTEDTRFAAAVAGFAQILRDSKYKGAASYDWVRQIAAGSMGDDPYGYRKQFLEMVSQAKTAKPGPPETTHPVRGPKEPCKCPPGDPLCMCF